LNDYIPPVHLSLNLAILGRYEEALRYAETSVSRVNPDLSLLIQAKADYATLKEAAR
jgi:hypothetical protein